MDSQKKLFLIDAYALIYRAYFAFIKNPRINSKGINTSAVFGFTNSLLEVIQKEKPTHLAVVFDTSKPTGRHVEFPQYKANREEMPNDLRSSLPYIDQLLEAFNIPKIFKDGFEADDIIGTIAQVAERDGFHVYMMTPDKDFAQLVSSNIFIYRPASKWQPTTVLGVEEVLDKFKIKRIDQVIDFLAMMGDSADNIPGINGVGEKTAQKFIQEYDSIEGLFANTNKLKGKIKEKVEASKEMGLLSKKLVTIITDVPVQIDLEEMKLKNKNEKKTIKLFEELEFRNLYRRIFSTDSLPSKTLSPKKQTSTIQQTNQQMDLFAAEPKFQDVKNEYNNLNSEEVSRLSKQLIQDKEIVLNLLISKEDILGIIITRKNKRSYYIKNTHKNIKLIRPVFESPEISKIAFDMKSIIKSLKKINVDLQGKFFDVQIAHYLLQPETRHSIDLLSENYLGLNFNLYKSILIENDETISYATQYSYIVLQLAELFLIELKKTKLYDLFVNVEMPLISVLFKMEHEGINLDIKMLKEYSKELSVELEKLQQNIYVLAGKEFNISSPKQMGEVLFDELKLSKKPKKTKSGQYSTSEETLISLKKSHLIINEILLFRGLKKLLSTYVNALPDLVNPLTQRVHTTFNQSVANTGRLSSINPNIQNIPIRTKRGMRVRKAFISRGEDYTILAADYSQIELRIIAALSKDQAMLDAFHNKIDIHTVTASKVYKVDITNVSREMRSNAKAVNFGIIYGISAFGLSQNIGISRTEAKQIIDQYFEEFPEIKKYMDKVITKARSQEYVETLMGRRRYLPEINSKNAVVRSFAERNAINAPIQGSAADIIKKAMILIQNEIELRNMKSRMLLQVHDELVFDMHQDEREELKEIVVERMENVINIGVPLTVELGEGVNWLTAH